MRGVKGRNPGSIS